MIEQLPEINIVQPEYPKNLTQHNSRQRKKMKILQFSNAIVQMIVPERYTCEVLDWWEGEYTDKGEEFLVELYTGSGFDCEVNFLTETPFYKCSEKSKEKYPSVQEEPEWYVIKALSMLPEELQSKVIVANLSDWDYLPVEDEFYEEA